ncbi:MAG: hypothetical protein U0V48_13405 [Anaerolineales bacterium]
MPDEKKSSRPETFFLPPLKMVLSFFDREIKKRRQNQKSDEDQAKEKTVNKLIEKLSEKEDKD